MMTPSDIATVLTAATQFVASLTPLVRVSEKKEKEEENKETSISVTINNNFYTNSEKDAVLAAEEINKQVVNNINSMKQRSMTRYTL